MFARIAAFLTVAAALGTLVFATPSFADRLVTDQIGRQLHIPDSANRVVILQH